MTDVEALHAAAPLTDIHLHPSLKAFLFNRNLWRHYASGSSFNPFSSRSDFQLLERGGVRVAWASHHMPERELFRDCFLLRAAAFLLTPAYWKLTTKTPWERLLQMMDVFEAEVAREPARTGIARSVADLDRISGEGKIAFIHTVEGAHPLDGDLDRVAELAARGVAAVTLSHFYPNGVGARAVGVPDDLLRGLCTFRFEAGRPPILTAYGRRLVRRLAEHRILVDLTHCWPETRRQIYRAVDGAHPLIASHIGVQALRPVPYNLDDEDIREIAVSGGLIGVIAMPYWLSEDEGRPGAELMADTMAHVADVAGSWDHVAIGSDFDGFTTPPDDVRDASELGAVTRALLARGVTEADMLKVLGGNADRVLRAGWR